jgi:hypothetical protein
MVAKISTLSLSKWRGIDTVELGSSCTFSVLLQPMISRFEQLMHIFHNVGYAQASNSRFFENYLYSQLRWRIRRRSYFHHSPMTQVSTYSGFCVTVRRRPRPPHDVYCPYTQLYMVPLVRFSPAFNVLSYPFDLYCLAVRPP